MTIRGFSRIASIVAAAVFSTLGCACVPVTIAAATAQPTPAEFGDYRIGPADMLQISVWKNDALSRTVPVRPDGMISLPLVNEIRAAGLTPMQLRDALKKKLAEYVPNAEVSVVVMEIRSFVVSVLGEVRTPGRYQLNSGDTVLEVLARAGGVTEFASRSDVVVLRSDAGAKRRIPFNYDKVIAAPGVYENFSVRPGDIVVVP